MKISEIMTTRVEVISPQMSLGDVARRMKQLDVGALPVCEGDQVVGLVTDRDLVVRGLAEDLNPQQTEIRALVSSPVHYCFEDQDVSEARELMETKKIRRVVVLDRGKRLAGVLSLDDLAVRGDHREMLGEVLEKVSEQFVKKKTA